MKRLFSLCFSVLLLAALISPAFAHRGNTDSQGGHWDYSTGEYHYHHGYGPHQHEDLDGDGDLDCPYDFNDKTNHSSGSSSSSDSTHRTYVAPKPTPTPAPVKKTGLKFGDVVGLIIQFTMAGYVLLMFIVLPIEAAKERKEDRARWEKQRLEEEAERKRIAAEKAEQKKLAAEAERRKFLAEKEKYTIMYGNLTTLAASGAPLFCYVGDDSLPAILGGNGEKWGLEYTFCVSSSGKRFHKWKCHCVSEVDRRAINAYELVPDCRYNRRKYLPCSNCRPKLPDLEWYEKYKEIKAIREKYDIPEPRN